MFQIINVVLIAITDILEKKSILRNVILTIRSTLFYPYGALWYLRACIIAILLLYYFIIKKKINIAIVISFILYVIGLLANSYYFLIEETALAKIIDIYLLIAVSNRNGLFVGFLFLGIGIWISNYKDRIYSKKLKYYSIVSFILTFLLYFLEVSYIFGKTVMSGDYFFFLPFVAINLFLFLTTVDINISHYFSKICRKISTSIYLIHRPVISLLNIVMLVNGKDIDPTNLFVFVISISFIIILLVYRNENSKCYNLLTL